MPIVPNFLILLTVCPTVARIVTFRLLLFFGLGISCSVAFMKALKHGKYSISSSVVLCLLILLYNFFGNTMHNLTSGSIIEISLQVLLVRVKQKS